MNIADRTVLIVGGTSGIGAGLAQRFRDAGSTVIVGGRSAASSADSVPLDVTDPASIERARDDVLAAHPDLDMVVTMSGVLLTEDLRDPAYIESAETTVVTNLLGTIRVVNAFTPHLLARGGGTIMTVSSGIGFMPFPLMASYGASKAAVHSFTESLRAQLAGTGIEVVELVPPAVATADMAKINPAALPLDDFLDEVVGLLTREPTASEIVVEKAQYLRWAERDGTYADLLVQRSAPLANLPNR